MLRGLDLKTRRRRGEGGRERFGLYRHVVVACRNFLSVSGRGWGGGGFQVLPSDEHQMWRVCLRWFVLHRDAVVVVHGQASARGGYQAFGHVVRKWRQLRGFLGVSVSSFLVPFCLALLTHTLVCVSHDMCSLFMLASTAATGSTAGIHGASLWENETGLTLPRRKSQGFWCVAWPIVRRRDIVVVRIGSSYVCAVSGMRNIIFGLSDEWLGVSAGFRAGSNASTTEGRDSSSRVSAVPRGMAHAFYQMLTSSTWVVSLLL